MERAAQIGGGEGGFETAHARIHCDAQRQQEAQRIDIDASDGVNSKNARLLWQDVGKRLCPVLGQEFTLQDRKIHTACCALSSVCCSMAG